MMSPAIFSVYYCSLRCFFWFFSLGWVELLLKIRVLRVYCTPPHDAHEEHLAPRLVETGGGTTTRHSVH